MQRRSFSAFIILLCLGLSNSLYTNEESSTFSSSIDTVFSCLHWICCPYYWIDVNHVTIKFQAAIVQNDTEAIHHIVCRRGQSPNQQLLTGELPIIYAAKKAHVESVEKLLKLGSDVNSQMKDNQITSYPSSLIAVCSTENLVPERVSQTVKVLLEHGADPSLTCVMLTEREENEFEKLREEYQKDPTKEQQIAARIPRDWFRTRTALDFADKHKYAVAAQMIRQALANKQKKGTKTNG